jgi:Tfp pilus tip-associated adhesin PilY1
MDKSIHDKFFVIKDEYPFNFWTKSKHATTTTTILSDLEEVSISGSLGAITLTKSSDFDGKKITQLDKSGWYVSLPESGEKVLATAITVDGAVVFNTLVTEVLSTGSGVDQCAAP